MSLSAYLYSRRVLRERVADLEARVTALQAVHAEELARVRAQADGEVAFARELLKATMLKQGMWPAQAAPRGAAPTQIPQAFEPPEPLWVAAARARAEEDKEYETAMSEGAADGSAPS